MIIDAIKEELETLIVDGALLPERVVEAARNPNSSMHDQFDWDDSVAAHEHRLSQARALIKRVKVNVIRGDNEVVKVSSFMRSPEGKGYEQTQKVLVNYAGHLNVILITLTTCATMLRNLAAPEVDGVIAEIESVKAKLLAAKETAA